MLDLLPETAELSMLTKPTTQRRSSVHMRQRERAARRGWCRTDTALQRAGSYPHPAGRIQRIETHISVIYLVGRYAYKIKKPVNPGFVDCTGVAARHRYCDEEVRLNRRLARGMYIGVTPIVRRGRGLKVGAVGTPVECAVRMRRFVEQDVFSRLLARSELGFEQIDRLAERLATFHPAASPNPPCRNLGTAALVRTQMETVLASLESQAGMPVPVALHQWCKNEATRLAAYFEARRAGGFVRECHGDLHLDNIVRKGNDVVMFDCIEFSGALRWIDVASDLAFLMMDLQAHGRDDLGAALLNGWLQRTGDFDALAVLRFYIVYRALVRALVEVLKAREPCAADSLARAQVYLECAAGAASTPRPYLLLCHGYSCSGKSTASELLAARIGAVRISSDTERKRRRPFAPPEHGALPATSYSRHATDAHYDALLGIARCVLDAGHPVLVDATFLKQRHRARFIELASALCVSVFLLDLHASPQRLAERIGKRAGDPCQLSDAGMGVLVRQLANEDPLTPDEAALTVAFDTDVPRGSFQKMAYWRPLLLRPLLGARRHVPVDASEPDTATLHARHTDLLIAG